ncbi:uncharacterized protein [Diadema antillarum]|uniref:uncharacterized protein n=1 Tax=Diadema antillarum TaxID=105358 RepID=UPI003A8C4970
MALNASDAMSRYRPFNHVWLDSAVQETLMPGSPWHQVYDKLSQALAKRIQPELSDPLMRAAIFGFLGVGFLQKYLSKWSWAVPAKDLEECSDDERQQILQSTQLLLKEKMDLAAADCGYLVPKKSASATESSITPPTDQPPVARPVPGEVLDTMSRMEAVFSTGMHRYLVQEEMTMPTSSEGEEPTLATQLTQLQRVSTINHPADTPKDTPLADFSWSASKVGTREHPVPNCWGQTSDLLGKSLCAVLRRDPTRLEEVCRKLSGRPLPGSLRYKVWNEVMLRNYKEAYKGQKSAEMFLRKNFAKLVLRGKAELRLMSTTTSPIDGLIETAVQEKYSSTPCLLKHRDQTIVREARETLNVLYVFNRSYQPFFIHWLYPLQLALQDRNPTGDKTDDRPYELALQLELLTTHTFPQWSEVLAIAQDVMKIVKTEDPEYHSHLIQCSQTNIKMDPQEFLVHQIYDEKRKASSFTTDVAVDSAAMATGDILASPLMFLRKWLGEGFVGVCDTLAVLYMWDQCFMNGWSHEVLRDLCLALLMLLRENFMQQAQDYHVMKQIFLSEPSRLYTLDIQKAFQLLQNEGAITLVPAINRRPLKENTDIQTSNPGLFKVSSMPAPKSYKPRKMSPIKDPKLAAQNTDIPPLPPRSLSPFKSPTPDLAVGGSLPQSHTHPSSNPAALSPNLSLHSSLQNVPLDTLTEVIPDRQSDELAPPSIPKPSPLPPAAPEDQEDIATNTPVKSVESQKPSSPTPKPPPPPDPIARPETPEWVLFDISATSDLPEAVDPTDGYDLYIDGVRFLPDNASIAKVTVAFLDGGKVNSAVDSVSTQAEWSSPARCPKFKHRATVETGKVGELIEFRVYTVERHTSQLVVLGSCLLSVYNPSTKKLNIGGHQLRMRRGYPITNHPTLPQSLDHLPPVPGCSLLVRLLVRSDDFLEAPVYTSGFYHSHQCKPNESEVNVIKHYKARSDWQKTEKEAILELARREDDRHGASTSRPAREQENDDVWSRRSDEDIERWLTDRLDLSKLPRDRMPPLLDLVRCVDYDSTAGVAVRVRAAFGLQAENRYTVVLTRLVYGVGANRQAGKTDVAEVSQQEVFLTTEMDVDSLMRSPRWKDRPRVLHPRYDERFVLFLQFFGMECTYQPDPSGHSKGMVKGAGGKEDVKLDSSSYLGWSVLPVFDQGCVLQGTFIFPIFQDTKDKSSLKGLSNSTSLESWIQSSLQQKSIKVHPSHPSAIASIWDAHFYTGQTIPLPRRDHLLNIAGDYKKFSSTAQKKAGRLLNEIILQSLPSVVQSEGTQGQKYQAEKQNFEEKIQDAVTDLMENALLSTGQAPLKD